MFTCLFSEKISHLPSKTAFYFFEQSITCTGLTISFCFSKFSKNNRKKIIFGGEGRTVRWGEEKKNLAILLNFHMENKIGDI